MSNPTIDKTPYDNLYFLGLIGLAVFFAFFKTAELPLLDAVESRNGVNAIEMWTSGDFAHVTYGNQADVWNAKPPLSIWLTGVSLQIFGLNEFGLRFPMGLATIFLFVFLYQTIRLYQQADFAFYSCLLLLSVKGLVGRHITDLGEYDAIFTCFAMAGTYYFLKFHDANQQNALFWSALCFGLSFFSKGFGVFVFLFGILLYMLIRRQFFKTIFSLLFIKAFLLFISFPLVWLYLNNFQLSITFIPNIQQEFLRFSVQYDGEKNILLFYDFLSAQFEWWHWLFLLSIPIGLRLIYKFRGDLSTNFTTAVAEYAPSFQAPRKREFTLADLLAREDLKPNIQLLLFSICIWLVLAVVCTISQNEQYLVFALPFIAITTAACIFYLNNRLEWFRAIFIGGLVFTFWGQLDDYTQTKPKPEFVQANEELLKGKQHLAVDSDLPAQDIMLYLRFYQPNLHIVNGEVGASTIIFCRTENREKYPNASVIYENEDYALFVPIYEDKREI
jgi:4-amino-4-deoxy-L-arabinose transferase-like glycosyltransferase